MGTWAATHLIEITLVSIFRVIWTEARLREQFRSFYKCPGRK